MSLLAVMVGGGLGSGARYLLGSWVTAAWGGPYGTLAVNVLGSGLLGFLGALPNGALRAEVRLLLTTGLLGGFTTYSTFNQEVLSALRGGDGGLAMAYAAGTLATCLVAGLLGTLAARTLGG